MDVGEPHQKWPVADRPNAMQAFDIDYDDHIVDFDEIRDLDAYI